MTMNQSFLGTIATSGAWGLAGLVALVGASGCGAGGTASVGVATVRNTAVAVPSASNTARVAAVLAQPDRKPADRALDEPRQAADVLSFLDVTPGMDVAILAPGSGYFLELVARSIGLDGRLFARNPPSLLAESGLATAWDERLTRPTGARVVRIDDELGKQLAVHGLDLVFLDHDYAKLGAGGIDLPAVDASVWNALREDGRFVVVEREADALQTRRAIESHGFRLTGAGHFLKSGANPSDWDPRPDPAAAGERRVLFAFVKPASLEGR
jgi:predicted methyltransferase